MANKLINEQSPYLLQHAYNPVNWYPWGDEAFELAKMQNRPVLVSIGYSACHWCHVMERESFENHEVAAYMNEHFINIKVDREEYPDVDDFYMTAIQALSGSGGWPLNAFVTPDRIPFYGGTYYPPVAAYGRPSWIQLLQRIHEIWENTPGDVQQQASQMIAYLENAARPVSNDTANWNMEIAEKAAENMLQHADDKKGGFGKAPKFPSSMAISYLLEHFHYTGNEKALSHALLSLDKMIEGGIYDQVGGGFSRYATDDSWLVPHFEKMLYDNAMLIIALCDAYAITAKPGYKTVIEQTIDFVMRELKAPNGGFYCALDADSEGEEGKYYVWQYDEWQSLMQDFDAYVTTYFGVSGGGNWEGVNILHRAADIEKIAADTGKSTEEIQANIEKARQVLFRRREQRIRPGTDDKCLLSWNALMNIALTKASVATGHNQYLIEAGLHLEWMIRAYEIQGHMMHTWKDNVARIEANLDDYAYLVQALLRYASASGEEAWIHKAASYMEYVLEHFSANDNNLFYYTSVRQKNVPLRKPDTYDGVMPSANAIIADNLALLSMINERSEWMNRAALMLGQLRNTAIRYSTSFAYWTLIMQRYIKGYKTAFVTGNEAKNIHARLHKYYSPGCFYFFTEKENSVIMSSYSPGTERTQIFICTVEKCFSPVDNIAEAIDFIRL